MYNKNRTLHLKPTAIVLLALAVCVMLLTAAALGTVAPVYSEAAVTDSFTASDSLVIAHITDTHYYPLTYCFNGDAEGTDYEDSVFTGAKMRLESSPYVVALLDEIVANSPDYVVVSGDLTLDGEPQSHVELANLLRRLQNTVRAAGNTDFQIFVAPGNHDMYNPDAVHFKFDGVETSCDHVTRAQIAKIYCGLGFPDLTRDEFNEFYATMSGVFKTDLPYTSDAGCDNYIYSTTAADVTISRLYQTNGKEAKLLNGDIDDYANGDLTYYAMLKDNYTLLSVDEEVSDEEAGHHVGGMMYDGAQAFFDAAKTAGAFEGKTMLGMMHHNAVPHFALEDTLLKDFTIYNWEDVCDYFADLGVSYFFTGHMHSNDIATYTTFDGHVITDMETASATGYGCGTRYAKFERGTINGEYADNLSTYIDFIDEADFSSAMEWGYMTTDYLARCGLTDFVDEDKKCTDPSQYAVTKLFLNIVDTTVYKYLSADFLGGLGDMLYGIVPDSLIGIDLRSIKAAVPVLIENIFAHIEDDTLAGYTYTGSNDAFKTGARYTKLCGFADDLVQEVLNMPVNTQGTTLFDFAMSSYLAHVAGTDKPYAELTDGEKEAFENFRNGTIVKQLINLLLDENKGLLRIVGGLFTEMDLTTNLTPAQVSAVENVLGMAVRLFPTETAINIDLAKFDLDAYLPCILAALDGLDILSLELNVDGMTTINTLIDGYITESFYTSLGEIAHNILYSFRVDETANLEGLHITAGETPTYTPYRYTAELQNATHYSALPAEAASIENGKLPSMLTVTFGANPTTDKNFVWYTDSRVTATDLQYCVGDTFNESSAVAAPSGSFDVIATTTANIDLGVFATLMHVTLGRHAVSLNGLQADTTYSYRVGSAANGWWSPVQTFRTAPSGNEKFELLLISDIQGSSKAAYDDVSDIMSNIESVFENGYDFVINCGDLVDNSRNLAQWEYFLNNDFCWGNTTQVVAIGNHGTYAYETFEADDASYDWFPTDAQKDSYNYVINHYNVSAPEGGITDTGAYYSFDYSGVHFTVLNTNDLSSSKGLSTAQLEWLKADLKATDKIKVVMMHKGLYSSGSHSYDEDVIALRAELTPIFADNGVHLVLSGHDHTYSTTYYLDANGKIVETKAVGKSKIGTEGTLYVTLGTLGDKFYNYVENPEVPVEFGKDLHTPTLTNPTFAKLVYDGKDLYYYGYEYDLSTDTITALRPEKGLSAIWIVVICVGGVAIIAAVVVLILKKRGAAAVTATVSAMSEGTTVAAESIAEEVVDTLEVADEEIAVEATEEQTATADTDKAE